LGELSIQCLFNQWLGPVEAATVAAGWGGDSFVAFRNGDEVAFIWATVWDSAKDASEFHDDYQKILSMKYGTPLTDSKFHIEKRDRSVIVIEGLERDRVENQMESIWLGIKDEQVSFQAPPFRTIVGNR
jgi:hypothetical protein